MIVTAELDRSVRHYSAVTKPADADFKAIGAVRDLQ
jgi:hypothetical protein